MRAVLDRNKPLYENEDESEVRLVTTVSCVWDHVNAQNVANGRLRKLSGIALNLMRDAQV